MTNVVVRHFLGHRRSKTDFPPEFSTGCQKKVTVVKNSPYAFPIFANSEK